MKISRKDLDESIVRKLDQFDNILNNQYEHNDGFVSYDPTLGFYFKKTNDTYLRKLYEEDEMLALEDGLYRPKLNMKSSAFYDMRHDKSKYNAAIGNLLFQIDANDLLETKGEIIKVKHQDTVFLFLDNLGIVYKYDDGLKFSVNIISVLRESLTDVNVFDISDIAIISEGFLVSILGKGIYKYSADSASIEMVIVDPEIKFIAKVDDKKVFVVSNLSTMVYSLESEKRLETGYIIKNSYQIPELVTTYEKDIFIVGRSLVGASNKLIHLWRKDRAGINFNNKDGMVSPHRLSEGYHILFIHEDSDYLYLAGLCGKKLFIWKYDLLYLNRAPAEIIFDCMNFANIDGLICYKDQYIVSIDKKIYGIQENQICLNLYVGERVHDLILTDDGIVGCYNNHFILLNIPSFKEEDDIIQFDLYDDKETCNNIDIVVLGAGNNESVSIVGNDREVQPSAKLVHRGNTYIKLLYTKLNKVSVKVQVTPSSHIRGIVVKKNAIFLR